jgi:hypothetical protein
MTQPKQRMTVTKYKIINDSIEIFSILKKLRPNQKSEIKYQDFVGKLVSMTFSNNSNENIYLLKPLHQDASETMFNNFTASIHLIQASNDSIKWKSIFYRLPVDTYEAVYDTINPNSAITKFAYIDNYEKNKYLKLLLEYRSDSSYFHDTIQIVNFK